MDHGDRRQEDDPDAAERHGRVEGEVLGLDAERLERLAAPTGAERAEARLVAALSAGACTCGLGAAAVAVALLLKKG